MLLYYSAFVADSLIETYILWFFFQVFLSSKDYLRRYMWIPQLLYFFYQLLTYFLNFPLFTSAIPTYLIAFLIAFFCFEDTLNFKLLVIHIFVFLTYACRTLVFAGSIYLFDLHINPQSLPVLSPYVQGVACLAAFLMTRALHSVQQLRQYKRGLLYEIIFLIQPAVFLISLVILFNLELIGKRSSFSYYCGSSLCLFVVSMIMFYHLDQIKIIRLEKSHSAWAAHMLEADKRHFAEILAAQSELIHAKHDIRKHLQTLQFFCARQQTDKALHYLDKLLQQKALQAQFVSTGNGIIDSLLNQNLPVIRSSGIEFSMNVMIPPHLPFDDLDLCVMISNLLANAQEASVRMESRESAAAAAVVNLAAIPADPVAVLSAESGRVPAESFATGSSISHKKYIHLTLVKKKSFLLIQVENSYGKKLRYRNGRYLSTKNSGTLSGIGLSNVRQIVDKYHGVMEITHAMGIFKVHILLPFSAHDDEEAADEVE